MVLPPSRGRSRPGDILAPAPEPRAAFQFPRMTYAEMQEDMKELYNCPVTREMLKTPSPADAKSVIDCFIEEVYSKRPEDMAQPEFASLESLDYPELYDHSIASLHYLRECQKLCEAASFTEFGIRDIHAPDKNRFHWELSALINFTKFRATRLESFEKMAGHADDLIEKERSILAEKSKLQHEISVIEEKRSAEQPEVENLRETVSEFSMEIQVLHKQQKVLMDEIRVLKENLAAKTKTASALKMQSTTLRNEIDSMSVKVVSSPDRVKGEIDKMRKALEAEEELIANMDKESQVMKKLAKKVKDGHMIGKEALRLANEGLENYKQTQELDREKTECKLKNSQFQKEVESIEEKREQVERWLESTETKIARVEEQQIEIQKDNSEEDHALIVQRSELVAEKEKANRFFEEMDGEREDLVNRIVEVVEATRDLADRWLNNHSKASDSFTKFHHHVAKSCTATSEEQEKKIQTFRELSN